MVSVSLVLRSLALLIVVGAGSVALLAAAPSQAVAQEVASGSSDKARLLFEEGVALADSGRWGEALSAFRSSQELVPRASTSYNIANALYRLDRPVEGLAELDRYDRMPGVAGDPSAESRGEDLRRLFESAAAELRLAITPSAAALFVDGKPTSVPSEGAPILLDPGSHSVRVTAKGYEPYFREIRVERGSRRSYVVALQPQLAETVTPLEAAPVLTVTTESEPLAPAEPSDRKRFVKSPGFWALIGGIAAVGIGVGVAVAVTRNDSGAPQCGTTGTCASTGGLTVSSF